MNQLFVRWGGVLMLASVFAWGLEGCGPGAVDGETIVAEIGTHTIPLREITDYITSSQVDYTSAAAEYTARRKYLDKLIEEELLVIGGYAHALDADIGLLEQVEKEKDKFLLDELYRGQVMDKLTVTEAELRDGYDHYFDRVRFRHILVEEESLADTVMAQLENGGDFGDLAEKYSFDLESRFRSGDMGRDFEWGAFPEPLNQMLFSLSVEEIGGPVETQFGWHIVQLTGTRRLDPQEFESLRPFLESRLSRRKETQRRREHLDEIRKTIKIEYAPAMLALWQKKVAETGDTIALVVGQRAIVQADALSADERDRVMYRFGAGLEVTLEEFCLALQRRPAYEQPDPVDLEEMELFAFNNSLYDILREEALRRKLDETEIYKERVRRYHDQLIAEEMRSSVLVRGVRVTSKDLRSFYDAYPDTFIQATRYHVRELLVFDSVQAQDIMMQVQLGSSLEQLARLHTRRSGMKSKGGDLGWLTPNMYSDIYLHAAEMEIGEVRHANAPGQYSIIQLLERSSARKFAYEEVEASIFDRLQKERTESVLQSFVDSIRIANPVVVHDRILRNGLADDSGVIEGLGS